jgi:hypothetical protein
MARIAILAVLTLVFPAWTQPGENMLRFADNNTEVADNAANGAADQRAARDMRQITGREQDENRKRTQPVLAAHRFAEDCCAAARALRRVHNAHAPLPRHCARL